MSAFVPICPLPVPQMWLLLSQKRLLLGVYTSVIYKECAGKQLWDVHWYTENESSPVQEFLLGLDRVIQVRFAARIDIVKKRTITEQNEAEYLERHLWECREERDMYRLIFSYVIGKRILLLHGFHSLDRQPTPPSEIDIAWQRLANFV